MMDRLDDDFGIDTIEMRATIAVAMEAGVAKFGDSQAAINLVKEVGKGTPLGRILGGGAEVTGKVFGVERVPTVKGQAMPAYDPPASGCRRHICDQSEGADHTAGYAVTANIKGVGGDVYPLTPKAKWNYPGTCKSPQRQSMQPAYCLFIAFAVLDQPETFQALIDMLNAFYGLELTGDDVTALGKSVLSNERDFNARAGFTAKQDRLPAYFMKEKLPPHDVTFAVKDEELDQVFNW